MCFHAHALADPVNRGGALETGVAQQSHNLADWEVEEIKAAESAVLTAQGVGGNTFGSFSFQSVDDLRANLVGYNANVCKLYPDLKC